jgi:hypothetical protein
MSLPARRGDDSLRVMRVRSLLLAAALGGCASAPTLVDITDVNPVVYQRDLDQCEVEAQGTSTTGPLLAGAIMGGTIGVGLGALAVSSTSAAAAVGGGAGTVAGGGVSEATATPLAAPPPAPRQSLADCLTAHGYKVISATK